MKKKIMILVEGQAEEDFVKDVLYHYFFNKNVLVFHSIIETSERHRGGYTTYYKKKNELKTLLSKSYDIVTTMFDYYKLGKDSPGWHFQSMISCYDKVKHLENAFNLDIDNPKFIPYIQLHEFEALLFVNPELTAKNLIIGADSSVLESQIENIKKDFNNNPEEINQDLPPSKRISSIFCAYKKTYHGSLIAKSLGSNAIKQSCPHFKEWIESLEG